jgi:hypothetical protein
MRWASGGLGAQRFERRDSDDDAAAERNFRRSLDGKGRLGYDLDHIRRRSTA